MDRRASFNAMTLIGGVALLAMWTGHALVTWVGPSLGYRHVAQAPAIELAVVLLCAFLVAAIARFVRTLRDAGPQPDWALPAFAAVEKLGLTRVMLAVVALQFAALFAGESLEQRAAGMALGGIAALFGSTLGVAPLLYLAAGIATGALTWLAARAIQMHATLAIAIVRAALAWLGRRATTVAQKRDRYTFVFCEWFERPLAHKLANRPPPPSARLA